MKIERVLILCLILIFKVNGKEQTIDHVKHLVAHKLHQSFEIEVNGTLTDAVSCLCKNGGTCEIIGNKTACLCPPKFAGVDCSLKDVCYKRTLCHNNGICKTKGIKKFYCICPAPFTGLVCTEFCDLKSCNKRGTCVDPKTSDKCVCEEGYYGDHCEFKDTNESTESTPTNTDESTESTPTSADESTESTPTNTDESTESTPTNTDESTESTPTNTDESTESTSTSCYCGHNSIDCYFDKNERKICYCKRGYAQKKDICVETCADNSECLNSGVCKIQQGRYGFCECKKNFGGDKCEINFLCAELEPTCKHMAAMCAYKNGTASCVCPPHKVYELDSGICKDICDEKSCLNGQCIISKSSSTCRCYMGYTGVKCDLKMSEHKYLLVIIFVLLAFILISFIIGSISFSWILWRMRTRNENQQERISCS